jgi:predicted O-methyltransferase YrrM
MFSYNYKHSQAWFLGSEIKDKLAGFLDRLQENRMLEIGCFEGLSSVFFADNFLNHPNARLTCVDPFLTISTNDHKTFLENNEEKTFDFNLSVCRNGNKITVHKVTSDEFFKTNDKTYNFIYIDGCHKVDFIARDMENSFKCLEKNGIMWMDDYVSGSGSQIEHTMNTFLAKHRREYELIHSGYQLAIRKL